MNTTTGKHFSNFVISNYYKESVGARVGRFWVGPNVAFRVRVTETLNR